MQARLDQTMIEQSLMRAAEEIGDIAPAVMARFYERFAAARDVFAQHGTPSPDQLEGRMVENVLYCMLHWLESPGEIRTLLWDSVPHHAQSLGIPPEHFVGFLVAVAQVIGDRIPADQDEERRCWGLLEAELRAAIEQACRTG